MAKVLLVEDDVKLAELTAKFLRHNDFEVVTLHHGVNAINAIEVEKPDLLILDIMLPGLDGYSICKAVRQEFTGPILFLTAKDSDFDHVKGLEIGADDYIIKPVEPYVLLARLNALLRRTIV